MGRPKQQEDFVPARTRIKEAFWDIYQIKPISSITVREIVEKAKCNRTTFYYHYQDVMAVLDDIEEETLPSEAPDMIVKMFANRLGWEVLPRFIASNAEQFKRICFLLTPQGDPRFDEKLRNAMIGAWSRAIGFDLTQASELERTRIEFVFCGLRGMLAECTDLEPAQIYRLVSYIQPVAYSIVEPILKHHLDEKKLSARIERSEKKQE